MKLPFLPCLRRAVLPVMLCALCSVANAQTDPPDDENASGILIDAQGVVRPNRGIDRAGELNSKRSEAFANEHLDDNLQAFSAMRLVSLPRLEQAYTAALDAGQSLPPEVEYVAGLQRIDYVFVNPETKDVFLAGPAEGFAPDEAGRMRGLTTGRPVIRLDHLVVAFRSVFRGQDSIGCSIDPDEGRLAELQRWVQANSTPTSSSGAKRRYSQMAEILGMENVDIWGVPPESHYALTLVDADFAMKRIALGTEPSRVRGIKSHLSLLSPTGNSMQRWWFAPLYDPVQVSEDGNAYHITGQRVQLMAQEERVSAGGGRSNNAFTRASTQQFAQLFTEHYPELAEKNPVFAQLQNLFDLAVVAALLRNDGVLERTGWRADVILDRAVVPVCPVPKQVPSDATTRPARGGTMLGLIGGVVLDVGLIAQNRNVRTTEAAENTEVSETPLPEVPEFAAGEGASWWKD